MMYNASPMDGNESFVVVGGGGGGRGGHGGHGGRVPVIPCYPL